MHSLAFTIGRLKITWFGIMVATGFLAGLLNWILLGKKRGKDHNFCSDMLLWVMVSGIVGARLAYVVAEFPKFASNPIEVFYVFEGGLIYYGGFLGAGLGLLIFAWRHKIGIISLLDFVITSVPLAHVFGRIGCFMQGCCHGTPFNGSFSVQFPYESQVWYDQVGSGLITRFQPALPVHPVQLYESLFNLVVYVIVALVYGKSRREGTTLGVYLLLYPMGRFFLEFLRGDSRTAGYAGLNVAQIMSLALFLVGIFFLLRASLKKTADETQTSR